MRIMRIMTIIGADEPVGKVKIIKLCSQTPPKTYTFLSSSRRSIIVGMFLGIFGWLTGDKELSKRGLSEGHNSAQFWLAQFWPTQFVIRSLKGVHLKDVHCIRGRQDVEVLAVVETDRKGHHHAWRPPHLIGALDGTFAHHQMSRMIFILFVGCSADGVVSARSGSLHTRQL